MTVNSDWLPTGTKLDELATPSDSTTLDVSTSAHGLCPKAPNDTTKFLRGDGTYAVCANGGDITVIDKVVTQSVISDTATETTVYTKNIPGGTLGTNNQLRLSIFGYAYCAYSSRYIVVRVKYGSSVMAFGQWSLGAGDKDYWHVTAYITAKNATNAQTMIANLMVCDEDNSIGKAFNGTTANFSANQDSTADKNLVVTGDWDATPGQDPSFTVETAFLELLDGS